MKGEIKITYVLQMTEEEAAWLRSTMQNPLYNEEPENENKENRRMREIIFNSLHERKHY